MEGACIACRTHSGAFPVHGMRVTNELATHRHSEVGGGLLEVVTTQPMATSPAGASGIHAHTARSYIHHDILIHTHIGVDTGRISA